MPERYLGMADLVAPGEVYAFDLARFPVIPPTHREDMSETIPGSALTALKWYYTVAWGLAAPDKLLAPGGVLTTIRGPIATTSVPVPGATRDDVISDLALRLDLSTAGYRGPSNEWVKMYHEKVLLKTRRSVDWIDPLSGNVYVVMEEF